MTAISFFFQTTTPSKSNSYKGFLDFEVEDQEHITTGRKQCACVCNQVWLFHISPNKEVYFGFQIQSFFPPTLPPHGKSPNNIVLQTGTDILSKPAAESSLGLPSKRGKRGGHIMVINTSQNTEGIHVWACSAAYVDPAASLRSDSAQAPTGISIIPS